MGSSPELTTPRNCRWASVAIGSSSGSATVTRRAGSTRRSGFPPSARNSSMSLPAGRVRSFRGAGPTTSRTGGAGRGPLPGVPLFVLTHRVPKTVPAGDPPYTCVTDGIERALEKARTAAAGKDVSLMGATVVQQCLRLGLLDVLAINLVPVVLGRGVRLLDGLEPGSVQLELVRVVDAPGVTHLTYRVVK